MDIENKGGEGGNLMKTRCVKYNLILNLNMGSMYELYILRCNCVIGL